MTYFPCPKHIERFTKKPEADMFIHVLMRVKNFLREKIKNVDSVLKKDPYPYFLQNKSFT